mgnify:FL=1
MANLTVADYLKYANLQMAAEGFLVDNNNNVLTGGQLFEALKNGNKHATLFTDTQARQFVENDGWTVVDQRINSTTGFSGTLFKNTKTNELVLSFRSTEFIDDAIRDSMATNTLEVHDAGWAFGQIADMEDWYAELKSNGSIPSGARLDVTGYSLGGHLATAFNLLHNGALNGGQVVTFNGAGVGSLQPGNTLQGVLADFKTLGSPKGSGEPKGVGAQRGQRHLIL